MPNGNNDFLAQTRTREPAKLLTEWVPKLGLFDGRALDLGCGSGAEAEFLARNGFEVDAIDKSETAVKYTRQRCEGLTVNALLDDFLNFTIEPERYALVTAINSLPFVKKEDCRRLLGDVQRGLKAGGAAVLAVFGPEHDWSGRADMSFWTLEEFQALWDGYTIHHLEEYKGMWPLMSGGEIFQHRIHLVAQKLK